MLDFEQESELDHLYWQCKTWFVLSEESAPQGTFGLKAELPAGQLPSVRFVDLPTDWSGYGALSFVAWSPDKSGTKLHLRIDDRHGAARYEDRYNRIFTLEKEPKQYCADLSAPPANLPGKKLNLHHIDLLMVFLYNQSTPTTLFLDDFHLLKECP